MRFYEMNSIVKGHSWWWRASNKTYAKIVYLFIQMDGNSSEDELLRFDKFCEHIKLQEEMKRSIISSCECLHLKPNTDNSSIIISEIEKLLKEEFKSESEYSDDDRIDQAFVIWTLLNLAYADVEYTESERKVIEYLIEFWKMDNVLIDEMNDTLVTVLALSNQIERLKERLKTANQSQIEELSSKSVPEVLQGCLHAIMFAQEMKEFERIEEYERNIKTLFSDIELSVLEAIL